MANPFRIHGTVSGAFFTDRASELRAIGRVLGEPGAKLLVVGDRRMGKTSTLLAAIERMRARGGKAFLVDLSTASTFADVATRLLDAAFRGIGARRGVKDFAEIVARHVTASLSVRPDPGTGLLIPSVQIETRRAEPADQQRTVGQVLDAIEDMARRHKVTIGIVLDEVQEIHTLGGEQAEWHLRGVIQHHQHVSYVLAGSRPSMLHEMTAKGRAFYGMLDLLKFGPIEPDHLAGWIDSRFSKAGLRARGLGAECIRLAGPRTRDVVQLARKVYDVAPGAKRRPPDRELVATAFAELVDEMDDALRAQWEDASPIQRDVLRAVAAAPSGLTTEATRIAFSLPASGSIMKAVSLLERERRLVGDAETPTAYAFDNPFFRGWVIRNTLRDIGMDLEETTVPGRGQGRGGSAIP